MKRFLTLFPNAENVHLIKDVGMIPYILQKEMNYDCTLASYKNGTYPYMISEVNGLKQVFIQRIFNIMILDVLFFLVRNRKRFDILQLYHLDKNSLFTGLFFKFIHYGKVKVYLKLDANDLIRKNKDSKLKRMIFRRMLSHMDLVSVESHQLQKFLSEKWCMDIKCIPNGFLKTRKGNKYYLRIRRI